ncbi:hypothetical protein [Methylomicrobium agile]|uniref:hypothetical protein n=1 Tax=Methylomicrobium agile TaxID=39774 RepID=UPI000AAD7A7B
MTKKIPDSEDSGLFHLAIGQVRAIKDDKVRLDSGEKPKPYPKHRPAEAESRLAEQQDYDLDPVSIEDRLSYLAPGVQKSVPPKCARASSGWTPKSTCTA